MGQTWSDTFPVPDGQVPVQDTNNVRHRSDSEPPTSWGGHAVTRIPENEEVNNQTSDIQYADWKKSSLASGILREKSNVNLMPSSQLSPEAPIPTGPHNSSGEKVVASQKPTSPQKKLSRSMSVDYAHLADFSMFPDKFSISPQTTDQLKSSREGRSLNQPTENAVPPTPPSTPLSNLANTFFRSRASSASEAMERPTRRDDESKITGPFSNSISDGNEAPVNSNLQVPESGGPIRPRSSSHSGRFPFFDFSMIPDKDPHFNDGSSGREEKRRYRRASSSSSSASNTSSGTSTSSSDDSSIGAVNAVPDGSSVVACLLTMAATSPDPPPVPNIVTTPPEGEGGNNIQQQFATAQPEIQPQHKTPANPPRFTFFDYSLIPDKDPRAFGQKPKVK